MRRSSGQAYQCCAYRQLEPKISIEEAIQGFLTKISTTCDCHLGFVACNDRAGMSPIDSATVPAVSYAYPVAGNGGTLYVENWTTPAGTYNALTGGTFVGLLPFELISTTSFAN